ncbi:ferredoxin [Micromonospora sediminicola]|uniref:ferredoxin n=1 Tax=Micromonospora sediminicola TaxID=946078 RepID=UPI0034070594
MRIVVDAAACDSTGLCASIAPELFRLDEDDLLHVSPGTVPSTAHDAAEQAARACPKLAITLSESV